MFFNHFLSGFAVTTAVTVVILSMDYVELKVGGDVAVISRSDGVEVIHTEPLGSCLTGGFTWFVNPLWLH